MSIALPAKNSPRSKRFEAIIDSGASICQFQAQIGEALGFDVKKGIESELLGIAGLSKIYLHDAGIYLPGGIVTAKVAFSYDLPILGLLGMSGFFDAFTVTFDPLGLCCVLDRIYKA